MIINKTKINPLSAKIQEKRCDGKYIKTLKKYNAACTKCGYATGVVVHHIDCNPKNNKDENLTVLCRNCHGEFHFSKVKFESSVVRKTLIDKLCGAGMTFQEMATLLGVTRQRIHQIYWRNNST